MRLRFAVLALLLLAMTACATRPWTGDPTPLDRVLAVSDVDLNVSSVRVLNDGRVLVTDDHGTSLWMLDKRLRNPILIGDSARASGRLMDVPGSWVAPYLGDSSLLIKSGLGRVVILDDRARPVRSLTARYPKDAGVLPTTGEWTVDMIAAPFTTRGELMVLPLARMTRHQRDSAGAEVTWVVRTSFADPERRDTVGRLVRPLGLADSLVSGVSVSWVTTGDRAGMFADGTIAIVRTKTYHVELIDRAGHRRDVALPHDWILLSAADKQAAMDTLTMGDWCVASCCRRMRG